jgi:tetratricopeptide (TPR) repeat protein
MENNLIFNENDVQLFCMGGVDYDTLINHIVAKYGDISEIYHNVIVMPDASLKIHKQNVSPLEVGTKRLLVFVDMPLDYCEFVFTNNVVLAFQDCFNTFSKRFGNHSTNDFAVNLWKQYAREFEEPKLLENCDYVSLPIENAWEHLRENKEFLAIFDDEMIELSNRIFKTDIKLPTGILSANRLTEQAIAMSKLLCERGDHFKAECILRQAIIVNPCSALNLELAMVIVDESPEEALDLLLAELAIKEDAQIHNNLSTTYGKLNQLDKAIEHAKKALELVDSPELHNNLGHQYVNNYQFEEGLKCFLKAVESEDQLYVWTNIGNVYASMRQFDKAIEAYERVLQIDPAAAGTHVNLGFLNYIVGNSKQAWKHCEFRLKTDLKGYMETFGPEKKWNGEDIRGKKLLVFGEQGLGDNINFVRYLQPLKRIYGCETILICSEKLRDLFKHCNGIDKMIRKENQGYSGEFDYHIPLMSLPNYLDCPIPSTPYIQIKDKIDLGSEFNVGICWKGNPKYPNDRFRSCDPDLFRNLAMPGVKLFNLQKGEKVDFAENIELEDFTDTARIINSLDLTITVDTSIMHLAGALDRPVWGLLNYVFDWRWRLDNRTEWYYSLRLFRQNTPGDWAGVFKETKKELLRFVNYRGNL